MKPRLLTRFTMTILLGVIFLTILLFVSVRIGIFQRNLGAVYLVRYLTSHLDNSRIDPWSVKASDDLSESAEVWLSNSIGQDPENWRSLRLSGILNLYLGKNEGAFTYLNKSLEFSPEDAILHFWIGYLFLENDDLDTAIDYLAKARAGKIILEKAKLEEEDGNLQQAEQFYSLVIKLIERYSENIDVTTLADAYRRLGLISLNKNDPTAISLLNYSVTIYPTPQALFDLANAYRNEGEVVTAIELVEKIRAVEPNLKWPLVALGELYLASDDLPAAEAYFDQYLNGKDIGLKDNYWQQRALFGIAQIKYAQGLLLDSLQVARDGLTLSAIIDPSWDYFLHQLYTEIIHHSGSQLSWYIDLGDQYSRSGRPVEAMYYYRLANTKWPDSIELIDRLKD